MEIRFNMTTEMKNKVNPDYLEDWLIKNPAEVYAKSVETALRLVQGNKNEEAFLEFYWEGEVYSKIFMKKNDIPTAMDKAIEFFVDHELYEQAVLAKKAKDSFNNL